MAQTVLQKAFQLTHFLQKLITSTHTLTASTKLCGDVLPKQSPLETLVYCKMLIFHGDGFKNARDSPFALMAYTEVTLPFVIIFNWYSSRLGARGGVVVALRYKPAGRGLDSRWCHWNFSVT